MCVYCGMYMCTCGARTKKQTDKEREREILTPTPPLPQILLTELVFEGVFNDLSASESAALLSVLFCMKIRGSTDSLTMPLALDNACRLVKTTATRLMGVYRDAKLVVCESEFVDALEPDVARIVYHWCEGMSFAKLCSETKMFEGSIVR